MRQLWILATITLVACQHSDETDTSGAIDTDTADAPAPLLGDWAVIGGVFPDQSVLGHPTITEATWDDGYANTYTIETWNVDGGYAIAQNGSANRDNPGAYSRFDWVADGDDGFFSCQAAWDADSAEAAEATAPPDDADLSAGCTGFAWSHLSPKLPIDGEWTDGYYDHTIDEAHWVVADGLFHVARYSVDGRFVIAQNDAANEWNPSKWSRFDYHIDERSAAYYCQSAYDAENQALAEQAESDHADLSGGCGGGPWSPLTAR